MVAGVWSAISWQSLAPVLALDALMLALGLAITTIASRTLRFSKGDEIAIVFAAPKRASPRAQKRLLSEHFGIEHIAAVYGFSMGAQQAYHWPAMFPDAVHRAIVVAGSARTSPHNRVFLLSLLATLEAAPEHLGNGRFSSEPLKALRAFSRNYAGWAMSQDWYRAGLHLSSSGAATLEEFLENKWEPGFHKLGVPARCNRPEPRKAGQTETMPVTA
jgi:pimeloyl-ACP methyl ester carboxylesterase